MYTSKTSIVNLGSCWLKIRFGMKTENTNIIVIEFMEKKIKILKFLGRAQIIIDVRTTLQRSLKTLRYYVQPYPNQK